MKNDEERLVAECPHCKKISEIESMEFIKVDDSNSLLVSTYKECKHKHYMMKIEAYESYINTKEEKFQIGIRLVPLRSYVEDYKTLFQVFLDMGFKQEEMKYRDLMSRTY